MERDGKTDQTSSDLKLAGEKAKDAFHNDRPQRRSRADGPWRVTLPKGKRKRNRAA
jgi:hypothetical protein